jgi:hypothetical protein
MSQEEEEEKDVSAMKIEEIEFNDQLRVCIRDYLVFYYTIQH